MLNTEYYNIINEDVQIGTLALKNERECLECNIDMFNEPNYMKFLKRVINLMMREFGKSVLIYPNEANRRYMDRIATSIHDGVVFVRRK